MVTGVEEYFKILEELQKNNTTLPINIQSGESFFDVDLNDRLIIVPPEFKKYIAVQRDHNIETIYFRVDRYFDTTDLSELTCVVQFTNARKESGIHLVSEKDLTTYSSDGKMILGWKLNRDFTQYPGTVTYSLRFYKLDENKKFIYDLHTIPAIGIIAPGLDTLEDTNAEEDTKPVANLITDLINRVDYACGPEMNGMMKNNIRDYFVENPVEEEIQEYITNHPVVSDDQVDNAVHDYLTANPPTGGATNVQVEEAVNGYFERNDIDGRINELLDENGVPDLTEAIGYTEIKHSNLFNKNDIIEGNTLQTDNGITRYDSLEVSNTIYLASTSMFTTHKIAVKEGDTVRNNIGWARCFFFNADGERLISIYATGSTDTKEIVAPPDASYVRFSFMNTKLDIAMITINEEMPAIYEPFYEKQIERIYNSLSETISKVTSLDKQIERIYNSMVTDKSLNSKINELLDEKGVPDLTEAIGYTEIKHVNLFNKNDIIEGNSLHIDISITRYDSLEVGNTAYIASTSMFTTHKIAVKEGDTVRNNIGWARCFFFTSNGERLISTYATGSTDTKEIVAPSDASYVRFSFMNKYLDIAMITINEEMPAIYEPYHENHIERTYNSLSETITRVTNLEKPLNGVKWVAFGDSLTSSSTLSNQEETKNYVNFVAENLGLNVKNMGVGGTGYKKTDNNFCNRISAIPTDTDILTVFGSFNDYDLISTAFGDFGDTTTETICGSMYYFFDEVYKRCPNVVIGCILPTKWGYLSDWKNKANAEKCDMYIDALIKTCNKFGIPYLDLYNNSGLRPWDDNFKAQYYRDDNNDGVAETVHPLSNAHKKFIAPKVEAFIKQIYGV